MTDENGRDHFKTHGPAGEKLAGKILRRLKFDNVTIRNTCRLIRYHDLRPTPDAEDVRRAVNLIGEELFPLYSESAEGRSFIPEYLQEGGEAGAVKRCDGSLSGNPLKEVNVHL